MRSNMKTQIQFKKNSIVMDLENNIVPGRSKTVTAIRRVANSIRASDMLNIKHSWVNWGG